MAGSVFLLPGKAVGTCFGLRMNLSQRCLCPCKHTANDANAVSYGDAIFLPTVSMLQAGEVLQRLYPGLAKPGAQVSEYFKVSRMRVSGYFQVFKHVRA